MQIWINLVQGIQLVTALAMIGLVLVQHGKGADMGASFGSGASGSLFGATGSANFLSRSTAVCAAVFFACTMTLTFMNSSHLRAEPSSGASVLDRAVAPAGTASGAAAAIPGAVPPVAAPASGPVPGAIPTN